MHQTVAMTIGVVAVACSLASCDAETATSPFITGSPPHYVDPEFGLNVALPAGHRVCVNTNPVIVSHGFLIPLSEETSCNSRNPFDRPFIGVIVDHSPSPEEDFKTTEDLAAYTCQGRRKRVDRPDLQIRGINTAVCSGPYVSTIVGADLSTARGLIETKVLAQLPGASLEVTFVTTEGQLSQDTETLKRVLNGIEIREVQ